MISIDGFPRASSPGMLRALDSLAIEYRWNTRALLLDSEEARHLLDKYRSKWKGKIRGWKDQIFRTQAGPVNAHAVNMAADAEAAMALADAGDVQFVQYSTNVIWAQTSLATTQGILRGVGVQGRLLATEQGVLSVLRTLTASKLLDRNDAINLTGQLAAEQVGQLQKLRELQLEDMTSKAAYQGYVIPAPSCKRSCNSAVLHRRCRDRRWRDVSTWFELTRLH